MNSECLNAKCCNKILGYQWSYCFLITLTSSALEENYLSVPPATEIACAFSFVKHQSRYHDSVWAVKRKKYINRANDFLQMLKIVPSAVYLQSASFLFDQQWSTFTIFKTNLKFIRNKCQACSSSDHELGDLIIFRIFITLSTYSKNSRLFFLAVEWPVGKSFICLSISQHKTW